MADHKVRAKMKGEIAEVRMLMAHPMETGNRTDPATKQKVPRNFIQELVCELNGEEVFSADWSWGVARNPYLGFQVAGAKQGDTLKFSWKDNLGGSDSVEATIS